MRSQFNVSVDPRLDFYPRGADGTQRDRLFSTEARRNTQGRSQRASSTMDLRRTPGSTGRRPRRRTLTSSDRPPRTVRGRRAYMGRPFRGTSRRRTYTLRGVDRRRTTSLARRFADGIRVIHLTHDPRLSMQKCSTAISWRYRQTP